MTLQKQQQQIKQMLACSTFRRPLVAPTHTENKHSGSDWNFFRPLEAWSEGYGGEKGQKRLFQNPERKLLESKSIEWGSYPQVHIYIYIWRERESRTPIHRSPSLSLQKLVESFQDSSPMYLLCVTMTLVSVTQLQIDLIHKISVWSKDIIEKQLQLQWKCSKLKDKKWRRRST